MEKTARTPLSHDENKKKRKGWMTGAHDALPARRSSWQVRWWPLPSPSLFRGVPHEVSTPVLDDSLPPPLPPLIR